MKRILALASVMLLAASLSFAQTSGTATANLAVTVGAEAAIQVNTSPAFQSTGIFGNYTGTTDLTYFVRTSTTGKITVKITTDFSTGGKGGGPSVASPPTSDDTLTFTCTAASPVTGSATPCATAQTASTINDATVVTFGATTQSAKAGNDATTSWTLTNDPAYAAGSYTAVATYTISAT